MATIGCAACGAVLNPQLSTPIVTAATPRDILMVLKGVKVLFIIDLAICKSPDSRPKSSGLFVVCEINITIVIFIVNRKANKIYLKLYKIIVVRIFMF